MKHILTRSIRFALVAGMLSVAPVSLDAADSPAGDLLEKGIYMEETKGDIDGAIAVYQQLVSQSRDVKSLAAQAQFRLAQCLLKKNRTEEATAALEKLIQEYPDEQDLVAKARTLLPQDLALVPVPWADGERLQFAIFTATGVDIGTTVYSADLDQSGERPCWIIGARLFAGIGSSSRVTVDADTFRPVRSRWKHDLLGEADATYSAREAEVRFANKTDVTKTPLDKPVYDNEEAVHLMRRLPLKVGYKSVINVLSSLGGGAIIPVGLDVAAKETVTVPAGEFECWRVNLSLMQSFWFTTDEKRLLVKFEAGGISAQLTSQRIQAAGQRVSFNDEQQQISLSAPPDWIIHKRVKGDAEGTQTVFFLDPENEIEGGQVRVVATTSISPAARQTARTWADADLADIAKMRQNLNVRPASWQPIMISGRPGISYLADYKDRGREMVLYRVHALGTTRSESFSFMVPADKLAAYKPSFDSIVASYRAQ